MTSAALSDDAPLDPDDELLVSYLDGELDRQEQTSLETRLLGDEHLRSRLQQLQTGWDCLEDLPDPAPSLKLVESTLELVVADIVKQAPPKVSTWSRWRYPINLIGLCLFGLIGSLAVVYGLNSRSYKQQLDDLAIAEHLDAYHYGSDLELMWELSANPAWSQMIEALETVSDNEPESMPNVAAMPMAQRESLLRNLPLEDREQLNSRWTRFTRLEPADQEQIRETAETVAKQANAKVLLPTMIAYAEWREGLEDLELRDRIESDDPETRSAAILEAVEQSQQEIARRSGVMLDEQTIDWIIKALRQVVELRVKRGDESIRRTLDFFRNRSDPEFWAVSAIVYQQQRPSRGRRGSPQMPIEFQPIPLQSDELEMIKWGLSDDAFEFLEATTGGFLQLEEMTLQRWSEAAILRVFRSLRGEQPKLLDRYQALKTQSGEAIDLLPPKEILKRLSGEHR
ncbi:MAG: anti-sigma factor [Rubripirellula sp.]